MTVHDPGPEAKLERLAKACQVLRQRLELEPLLQQLIRYSCELTGSQASSVLLYEEETGLLKFVATPPPHWNAARRVRVPIDNSVAGVCFTRQQPVVIHDAADDPQIFRELDQVLGFRTVSILAVPLMLYNRPIGVIEAVNKQNNARYTRQDAILLQTISVQVVTALRLAEMEMKVKQALDDVEQLERMKSDFIAITSHELRTPLGLILGHASLLEESLQDGEEREQALVILESAQRLKEIIDDLDSVEKAGQKTGGQRGAKIDLNKLIEDVCATFAADARSSQIGLIIDLPEKPLMVEAAADNVSIALSNLLKNALTYTNAGGHVLVTAEHLPGYVKVSVVDDGIGIPASDLQRVFDRFYQVESHRTRRHGGMGLGLAVAKVMIESHGGQIWAESMVGHGSNFSFLLPCGPACPPEKEKQVPAFSNSGELLD